jgi:hypothetical protein
VLSSDGTHGNGSSWHGKRVGTRWAVWLLEREEHRTVRWACSAACSFAVHSRFDSNSLLSCLQRDVISVWRQSSWLEKCILQWNNPCCNEQSSCITNNLCCNEQSMLHNEQSMLHNEQSMLHNGHRVHHPLRLQVVVPPTYIGC